MKIIKFPGYLTVDPSLPPRLGGNPVFHAGKRYESVTAMRKDMTPLEQSLPFIKLITQTYPHCSVRAYLERFLVLFV